MKVGFSGAAADCEWTRQELHDEEKKDDGTVWLVEPYLWNPEAPGSDYQACVTDENEPGIVYTVRRNGVLVGRVCLSVGDQIVRNSPLPVVTRAFKEFSWPASELSVQPPDGRTLVNLRTIFFTTNDSPHTQVVDLAGWRVTIEATPTSYRWNYGNGSSQTTKSPGHAHPDEDVFHVYRSKGDVSASVDTTYSGRFRIGDGAWQAIPSTLTLPGAPVDLTVLEARPELVLK